ncbi:MAG TPA: tRNA uridine-5-carboxymethylaminomethyl(34) synthesis GTPase MnmE [Candidatus Merdibacter merdavium]|uniref:tRNA modification GTPase MnmE n=1 Tax=Candidatus Merdibacter merdavium TaxID=2838692 RepID=A0A9D2NS02_9FIRM|nr:tRNA uridine-5-carboxymethylaminomethyl(34) synthesis GTPase MnmE [Candidatus Merdibacter merdavium]
MLNDTITAIATALQDGAISIIRISGDQAIAIADALFDRPLSQKASHTVTYGFINDPHTGKQVDEVLVSLFRAPRTYTREDVVEISCHGGRCVTSMILQLVLAQGARLAKPGEFTQRAFLNGRIDLPQAEAVNDMIQAQTRETAELAVQGIRGSVRKLLDPLIQELLDMIANIEVNIDYPEYEDIEEVTQEKLMPAAKRWLTRIDDILKRARSGQIIRDGIRTAIVGRPNVGKSSLLNALLEEEKAIVTDIAGTTRDIVEGQIMLDGLRLNLIDTAGIRTTDDVIEKKGIEKSYQIMDQADLIIIVLDGSEPLQEEDERLLAMTEGRTRIIAWNKADLGTAHEGICISAKHEDIHPLTDEIHRLFDEHRIVLEQPSLANERQLSLMLMAKSAMLHAIDAMESGMELELVEIDLQECYTSLKEILGEVHREDLLDTLFANFCLGK